MLSPITKTVFGNTGNLSLAAQKPAVLHIELSKDFTLNETVTNNYTPSSNYPYVVDVDPLNCWDPSKNVWQIPATGFYILSVSLVYTNNNQAGLLTRINRSDNRDDSVATNFYFYNNNRSDGKQFVNFTKVIYFKQGEMLSIISKADGYTPTTLYKDFFGIKTEITVALLTGL